MFTLCSETKSIEIDWSIQQIVTTNINLSGKQCTTLGCVATLMYVRAVTFQVCLQFFPSYSFPLARSLSFTMHSQCDWSPPSFGITESPLGQNREPGKTHTQEKTKGGEKEPVWGTMRKVKRWRKQARKWKCSQDSVKVTDRGEVLRTKKRGYSSPFKRTCSLDLCWVPLINFFQLFQPSIIKASMVRIMRN